MKRLQPLWIGILNMAGKPLCAMLLSWAASSCGDPSRPAPAAAPALAGGSTAVVRPAPERRLANIRQLTHGGENAEAYFSADGRELIFQSTRGDLRCDQIFRMELDGSQVRMVSTGKGRTTCSYFFPDGSRIVYASTHLAGKDCPTPPPRRAGGHYVWPVFRSYDIFSARPDGSDLRRLTDTDGYDAEATISPDGRKIVFTSARDGDLELYTMNPDGTDQRRITHTPGYDGGAFFSPDSRSICFRASRPRPGAELDAYRALLAQELVEPVALEIFTCDAEGGSVRQVTHNGAANFCPFFHPSGSKIIYASNQADQSGYNFDLYLIDLRSGEEERITFDPTFDAFPMFSPDGRKLVWGSNRNPAPGRSHDTNIFLADWIDDLPPAAPRPKTE
jgi:TolB protein